MTTLETTLTKHDPGHIAEFRKNAEEITLEHDVKIKGVYPNYKAYELWENGVGHVWSYAGSHHYLLGEVGTDIMAHKKGKPGTPTHNKYLQCVEAGLLL